jgi:hypothetical protein
MPELDRLSSYDSDTIGREFATLAPCGPEERRRIEARRNALLVQEWKESFSDSQRVPKAALRNMCEFETARAYSESLITWSVTIVLAALAGVICAFVIRQLNL